jgi:hypothetical protein
MAEMDAIESSAQVGFEDGGCRLRVVVEELAGGAEGGERRAVSLSHVDRCWSGEDVVAIDDIRASGVAQAAAQRATLWCTSTTAAVQCANLSWETPGTAERSNNRAVGCASVV